MKEPIGFLPAGVRDLMPTNYERWVCDRIYKPSEAECLVGIALGLAAMPFSTFRMSGRGQMDPPRSARARLVADAMREGMMISRDAKFEGVPVVWPEYPRGWDTGEEEEEDEQTV